MNTTKKSGTHGLVITAMMSAVLAVLSPFSIFIGPVPLSLCTLGIYVTAYLLGKRRASIATLVYILLGMAGLPIFSGFSGGLAKVMGPTGGYILGYLPLAFLAGLVIEKFPHNRWLQSVGLLLATLVLYVLGTAWFCIQAGQALSAALGLCVLPFLPGDAIKITVAVLLGPLLRNRLQAIGLL